MQRRTVLAAALAAPLAGVLVPTAAATAAARRPSARQPRITWTIFSRHLQWLTTQAAAQEHPYETGVLAGEAAAEMGYTAVDLTVRPGGHVEPALARTHLQPMVEGVRSTGVTCEQITTGISDLGSDDAEAVLRAASGAGIRYYRWGTFNYATDANAYGDVLLDQLDATARRLRTLAKLNRRFGLTAIYHTFSGGRVGSSVWDLVHLLRDFDPDELAVNFDIGHLTAEGAAGSWRTNLRYAMPSIRGIGLKDVVLARAANGSVRSQWVAAGQGFVQWREFFQLLRDGGFAGPCEAQIEYTYNGVNLNSTFWADSPSFTLTRAEMLGTIAAELSVYRQAATAAGWLDHELH